MSLLPVMEKIITEKERTQREKTLDILRKSFRHFRTLLYLELKKIFFLNFIASNPFAKTCYGIYINP